MFVTVQKVFEVLGAFLQDHPKITVGIILSLIGGLVVVMYAAVYLFLESIKVCPAIVIAKSLVAHVDIIHANLG